LAELEDENDIFDHAGLLPLSEDDIVVEKVDSPAFSDVKVIELLDDRVPSPDFIADSSETSPTEHTLITADMIQPKQVMDCKYDIEINIRNNQ
jgi:hypothetical protein